MYTLILVWVYPRKKNYIYVYLFHYVHYHNSFILNFMTPRVLLLGRLSSHSLVSLRGISERLYAYCKY